MDAASSAIRTRGNREPRPRGGAGPGTPKTDETGGGSIDFRKPKRRVGLTSGYERDMHDFYVEPTWAVNALLAVEKFTGTCLDPACGSGTIPRALRAARDIQPRISNVYSTDLVDRGFGAGGVDFLKWPPLTMPDHTWAPEFDNVISNPPYKIAQQFAEKALQITRHKVALILRLAFLESHRRVEFFERTPLARVWIFAGRVSMPPGNSHIEAKGGTTPYAWFVWDHDWRGPPTVSWLRVGGDAPVKHGDSRSSRRKGTRLRASSS